MQFRGILPVLFDFSAHGSAKCRTTIKGSKAKKQGGAKGPEMGNRDVTDACVSNNGFHLPTG